MPVREKAIKGPARARLVPSLVPVHMQRAGKPRAFLPTAVEFTAERDSPLEGSGFELSVPASSCGPNAVLGFWGGIEQPSVWIPVSTLCGHSASHSERLFQAPFRPF